MCLSSLCSRNSESKPSPNGVWDGKCSRKNQTDLAMLGQFFCDFMDGVAGGGAE